MICKESVNPIRSRRSCLLPQPPHTQGRGKQQTETQTQSHSPPITQNPPEKNNFITSFLRTCHDSLIKLPLAALRLISQPDLTHIRPHPPQTGRPIHHHPLPPTADAISGRHPAARAITDVIASHHERGRRRGAARTPGGQCIRSVFPARPANRSIAAILRVGLQPADWSNNPRHTSGSDAR